MEIDCSVACPIYRKLMWVLPHPTPYNIYLVNVLNARLPIPSEVIYGHEQLPSHPWTSLPPRNFIWRCAEDTSGRARKLEAICRHDQETLYIFVNWRDATTIRPLLISYLSGTTYAFWRDTPKPNKGLARKALNAVFRQFALRSVAVLATGRPAIETFQSMGIPSEKLTSFPFVVDLDHFHQAVEKRQHRLSLPGEVTFVISARLDEKLKGQGVAIRAMALLGKRFPSVQAKLLIAGAGPDAHALKQLAHQCGVTDSVSFLGWVAYEDMPGLLGDADAMILPSHWDPYPVTVIEAMAAGLPVLGSSVCGSVRERVEHGVAGFVHAPGDHEALAEHMKEIALDLSLRQRMGAQALAISKECGVDWAVATIERMITSPGSRS